MDATRLTQESPRPNDFRSPFRLDRDRILYAAQFARLAETTQVVSPEQGYVFHNRLTHSLKVGQIARSIAEMIRDGYPKYVDEVDADAAEAAGLAHDLGHPPFGHIAEKELNTLVRSHGLDDGFEGNAQSFRIVCRLAAGDALDSSLTSIPGLNFTRTTLNGILKYPWGYRQNPDVTDKWGYYSTEKDAFRFARQTSIGLQRSLIAEIMDWADDLTYAVHDVLDFYRARKIPLEQMRRLKITNKRSSSTKPIWKTTDERIRFLESMFVRKPHWRQRARYYEAALDQVMDYCPFDRDHRYRGVDSDEFALYVFSTQLITEFVIAVRPVYSGASKRVTLDIPASIRYKVDVLKQLVWTYVIKDTELAVNQVGQVRAIRFVFRTMMRACNSKTYEMFPDGFRSRLESATTKHQVVRAVADYIAGLTERDLMHLYSRISASSR